MRATKRSSGPTSVPRALIAFVVITSLLAACSGEAGETSSTSDGEATITTASDVSPDPADDLEALAVEEGALHLYTSWADDDAAAMADAFEADFPGIDVTVTKSTGSGIIETFMADFTRGSVQADVLTMASVNFVDDMRNAGSITEYVPDLPMTEGVSEAARFAEPWAIAMALTPVVWAYRADAPAAVVEAFESGSWDAIVDDAVAEELRGQVAMADPAFAGSGLQAQISLMEALGENRYWAWVGEFAKLEPIAYESNTPAIEAVVSGERLAAFVIEHFAVNGVLDSSEVRIRYFDPNPSYATVISLATDAPHPNAGKLWMNWVASESGQRASQDVFNYPVTRPDMGDQRGHTELPWYSPDLMDMGVVSTLNMDYTLGVNAEEFLGRFQSTLAGVGS